MLETQETQFLALGWEDPLEEEIVTHSSPIYSCLENPHGQRSLSGPVHVAAKSQT